MKKALFILICLIIALSTASCADRDADYLSYQSQDSTFVGTCILPDGEYVIEIGLQSDGGRSLTFLSPETIEGCSYFRSAEGDYAFTVDDMTLPVSEHPTAEAIFDLFSLDPDDLLSAELEENAGVGLNVLKFEGDITVYLSADSGLPLRFEHPMLTLTLHADA